MRGHQSLFEARKHGYEGTDVWIVQYADEPEYTYTADPENLIQHGYQPEIHIYAKDNPNLLDLRCVMGLNVHMVNESSARLLSVIKRFKPKEIYLNTGERNA